MCTSDKEILQSGRTHHQLAQINNFSIHQEQAQKEGDYGYSLIHDLKEKKRKDLGMNLMKQRAFAMEISNL